MRVAEVLQLVDKFLGKVSPPSVTSTLHNMN
jgi:hypothetical protein